MFVVFTAIFIAVMVLKGQLKTYLTQGLDSDNPFSNMYRAIYEYERTYTKATESIFKQIPICSNDSVLIKCNEAVTRVFKGVTPATWVSGLAGLMERTVNCAGIGDNGTHDYYFKGTPKTNDTLMPESCKSKVVDFIDSMASHSNIL